MNSTPYQLWGVEACNQLKKPIPRDVLLSCTPDVLRLIEWGKTESIEQHSDRWFSIRKELIVTGSILNGIVGRSKYEAPEDVFLQKMFQHPKPFLGNEACDWGTKYEDEAYLKWCQREKRHGFTMGLLQHPEFKYMGGSLDGMTNRGELVEIKCPLYRWIKPGVVPDYYYFQPQFYMWLLGLRQGVFLQYKPEVLAGTEILDATDVAYDEAGINSAVEQAKVFAEQVIEARKTGILPDNVVKHKQKLVRKLYCASLKANPTVDTWDMMPDPVNTLYQVVRDSKVVENEDELWLQMLQ